MIGTALAISPFGLIVVVVIAAFFGYEERFLAGEFPATFPDYQARTKMLIPFVF